MEQTRRLAPPGSAQLTATDVLTLLDWKRAIFTLYADVRASRDAEAAWRRWRDVRERLLRTHPQSPVSEPLRDEFRGCRSFEYECYGDHLAETLLGAAIEKDRASWILATKFGHRFQRRALGGAR